MEPIKAKVAKVISTREVVLNRGAVHGVKPGMVFAILDPSSQDILDPDSGEVLGSLYRPKAVVKVTDAQPALSIAKTFRQRTENAGGRGLDLEIFSALSRSFLSPRHVYETFRTSEAPWEPLAEGESFVKVGDPVEEVGEEATYVIEGTAALALPAPALSATSEVRHGARKARSSKPVATSS